MSYGNIIFPFVRCDYVLMSAVREASNKLCAVGLVRKRAHNILAQTRAWPTVAFDAKLCFIEIALVTFDAAIVPPILFSSAGPVIRIVPDIRKRLLLVTPCGHPIPRRDLMASIAIAVFSILVSRCKV